VKTRKNRSRHLEAGKIRKEQIRQVSTSWKKLGQLSAGQDNSANFSKSQDKTIQEDSSGGWFSPAWKSIFGNTMSTKLAT
jgi:hypothetical protein